MLLSAWLLAFAPDPADPGWTRAFAPDAVAAQLDRDGLALRIVPAGNEAEAAASALEAALQGSSRVSRIERVASGGDANEGELVARAAADGFDRVAIVRVFAIGSDARKQAVVTIYDGKGTAIAAFTAFAGEPMTTASASAGISDHTASAVAANAPATDGNGAPGWQERYDELFVGFDDVVTIGPSSTPGSYDAARRGVVPYRGKHRERLVGAEFYRYIGHDRLAREYERRRRKRVVMLAAGGGVGLTMTIAGMAMIGAGAGKRDGGRGLLAAGAVVGGVGLAGGLVVMLVAASRPLHPVGPAEAERLAESFNRDLRERLRRGAKVDVQLGLSGGRDGAMLVAHGRF